MTDILEKVMEDVETLQQAPLEIGALYPTEAMRVLIGKYRQIRTYSDDKVERVNQFRKESCVYTYFEEMRNLLYTVLLFKRHIPLLSNKEAYDKTAKPEIEKYCETMPKESSDITLFYMCLLEHFIRRNYAFLVFTANGRAFEVIDLLETPENARFVTIEECNCCRKQATVQPLVLCGLCRKAAYCNKECQTSDWRAFHKHYCLYLVKSQTQ